MYPIARDLNETKVKRHQWAELWKDKLDFEKNCVFIDEAGFNTSMRREVGWSKKGEKAVMNISFT